jgi:hypothetical protein
MALLQQERERNGSLQAAEPVLPELSPAMFLSPAAQREVEAQQSIPNISLPLVSETIHANRQELSISPTAGGDIDLLSSNWDISEEDLSPPQFGTAEVAPDLANLFMDRALRETGSSTAELRRAERLGVDDFSFSTTDFDMGDIRPSGSASGQASGGVVVSRRGPTGFTPISRQEAVARQMAATTPQQRSAPAPQPQPAPSVVGKSRYERLMGPSIID